MKKGEEIGKSVVKKQFKFDCKDSSVSIVVKAINSDEAWRRLSRWLFHADELDIDLDFVRDLTYPE